jgi:hypothetical protein
MPQGPRLAVVGLPLGLAIGLGAVGQTLLLVPSPALAQPAAAVGPPPPPPPLTLPMAIPDGSRDTAIAAPAGGTTLVSPDPALQRLVASAAEACRSALARRFATRSPQVQAWLVPSLTIAIEAGDTSLAALRRDGLAFGWMVLGKPDPLPIGVCRTDGAAAVRAIEVQPD